MVKSSLLYPVKQKDYQQDEALASNWRSFEDALRSAWAITIFGYGAPKADVEAIDIMKKAWGDSEAREFEETEIIDVRTEDDLRDTWSPFIHTHHYTVIESFYDSYIARFPRRSGEALFTQLIDARFIHSQPFPRELEFPELYEWLRPRREAELQAGLK